MAYRQLDTWDFANYALLAAAFQTVGGTGAIIAASDTWNGLPGHYARVYAPGDFLRTWPIYSPSSNMLACHRRLRVSSAGFSGASQAVNISRYFRDSTGASQAHLWLHGDGSISIRLGQASGFSSTVPIANSLPGAFPFDRWFLLEEEWKLDTNAAGFAFGTGAAWVKVNDTDAIVLSNTTTHGPTTPPNVAEFGQISVENGAAPTIDFGPYLYYEPSLDMAGTATGPFDGGWPSTFPTRRARYACLRVNGAGSHTDFSPTGAATDWQAVQDIPGAFSDNSFDGDTTTVETTTTPTNHDLYTVDDFTAPGTIKVVVLSTVQRRDDLIDSAPQMIALHPLDVSVSNWNVGSNGTRGGQDITYLTSGLPAGYLMLSSFRNTDDHGAAWTASTLNGYEWGISVGSTATGAALGGRGAAKVSVLAVEVAYLAPVAKARARTWFVG